MFTMWRSFVSPLRLGIDLIENDFLNYLGLSVSGYPVGWLMPVMQAG